VRRTKMANATLDKEKVQRLIDLLRRLNAGEPAERVKRDAREFLASISPRDLSLAEQRLIEEGVETADLRRLCEVHLEAMEEPLGETRVKVEPGHVLDTLYAEHDEILGFLDELEKVSQSIQRAERYDPGSSEYAKLAHIAEHLAGAEKHHQREEEVLFPEVERRGVYGPTQVMKMEHEDLRARKRKLQELAQSPGRADFDSFKEEVGETARFIVDVLREHIFKENNILYPTALDVIDDEKTWDRMKSECDKIGYCCFTPKA